MACAQTSVSLRNAIKVSCSCVHLRKFIVLNAVVALAVSLLQRQNGKNCDGSEEELGTWREKGREDRERKCSHNAMKSASRTMSTSGSTST